MKCFVFLGAGRGAAGFDLADDLADGDVFAGLDLNMQDSGVFGLEICGSFFRIDDDDVFAAVDVVAVVPGPLGDSAFADGFAGGGHYDVMKFGSSITGGLGRGRVSLWCFGGGGVGLGSVSLRGFLDATDNLADLHVGAFLDVNLQTPGYVGLEVLTRFFGVDDDNVFALLDDFTVFFQPLCEGSFAD